METKTGKGVPARKVLFVLMGPENGGVSRTCSILEKKYKSVIFVVYHETSITLRDVYDAAKQSLARYAIIEGIAHIHDLSSFIRLNERVGEEDVRIIPIYHYGDAERERGEHAAECGDHAIFAGDLSSEEHTRAMESILSCYE